MFSHNLRTGKDDLGSNRSARKSTSPDLQSECTPQFLKRSVLGVRHQLELQWLACMFCRRGLECQVHWAPLPSPGPPDQEHSEHSEQPCPAFCYPPHRHPGSILAFPCLDKGWVSTEACSQVFFFSHNTSCLDILRHKGQLAIKLHFLSQRRLLNSGGLCKWIWVSCTSNFHNSSTYPRKEKLLLPSSLPCITGPGSPGPHPPVFSRCPTAVPLLPF